MAMALLYIHDNDGDVFYMFPFSLVSFPFFSSSFPLSWVLGLGIGIFFVIHGLGAWYGLGSLGWFGRHGIYL